MNEPYTHEMQMPNGQKITSIVIDQDEFNDLCDKLMGIFDVGDKQRATPDQIEAIKAAKIIPMMARGTKTEFVFEQYKVKTDRCCIIVRGHGEALMTQMENHINKQSTNPESTNDPILAEMVKRYKQTQLDPERN